jgi:hypothetical protein
MAEHQIMIDGTGFFSKATCTGCAWTWKGHADQARSVWEHYHADGKVIPLPDRVALPPMAEDPTIQWIEHRIIQLVAHHVDYGSAVTRAQQFVAVGNAEARQMLLGEPVGNAAAYVADLSARIASLSRRQREKLRHPSRNRAAQQEILENE